MSSAGMWGACVSGSGVVRTRVTCTYMNIHVWEHSACLGYQVAWGWFSVTSAREAYEEAAGKPWWGEDSRVPPPHLPGPKESSRALGEPRIVETNFLARLAGWGLGGGVLSDLEKRICCSSLSWACAVKLTLALLEKFVGCSLCARPPGWCLGASGLGGKEATEPPLPVSQGRLCSRCATNQLCTLGETPFSESQFSHYKMGVGETSANEISEVLSCNSMVLRIVVLVKWLLPCDG